MKKTVVVCLSVAAFALAGSPAQALWGVGTKTESGNVLTSEMGHPKLLLR